MASRSAVDDRKLLRQTLRKMNRAWSRGRVEDLKEYFHKDIVVAAPGFTARAQGRDAVIQSYREFVQRAAILSFRESDISIDVWGGAAVVTYLWEILYEMGGQAYSETGREILFFVRARGRWRVVWRTLLASA
jgi:hypothetical protein